LKKVQRTNGQAINYARPGTALPPQTRVQVRHDGDRIEYIDPPLAKGIFRRRLLMQMALLISFSAAVLASACLRWHLSFVGSIVFVSALCGIKVLPELRWWRQAIRYPTVIEISARTLALTLPSGKCVSIPFDEVDDIRASKPRRMLGVRGRVSSLVIVAWGRRFRSLWYRDYIEVRWLARHIRIATGRAVDHPGEPAVQIAADEQEVGETHGTWSGPLPPAKPGKRTQDRKMNRLGRTLSREYDQFGCAPNVFLLFSMLVGIVTIGHLLDELVICLQFGFDAYFRDGVRPVPHKGFFNLSNGQMIAPPYRLLFFALYFVVMPLWMGMALLAAIGFNRLATTFRERRQRSKRAKQLKGRR
jgi:hypothetical protein